MTGDDNVLTYKGLKEYDTLLKDHIKEQDDQVREDALLDEDYFTNDELSDLIAEAEEDYYSKQ